MTFVQGAVEHGAQWRLPSSGHLEAIDEEARWLTETASPTGVQTFAALPTPAPLPTADEDDMQQREALIDQLNSQRGKPQEIEYDIDEDEEDEDLPHLPAGVESLAARIHSLTEARRSSTQADEETQSGAQTDEPPLPLEQLEDGPSAPTPKKSKRRSVPSWDEIVFGSRA